VGLRSAKYLFLGLPPGNAYRFALDPDNDNLTDGQEAAMMPGPTNRRNRDSDGDTYDDGYESQYGSNATSAASVPNDGTPAASPTLVLDHFGGTFAKFRATFDEPVLWQLDALDANNSNAVISTTRGAGFVREATIHMHELYPSTELSFGMKRNYTPRLILTDQGGHVTSTTYSALTFQAADALAHTARDVTGAMPVRYKATIADLTHVKLSPPAPAGSMHGTVRVQTKAQQAGIGHLPHPNRVVVAHVLHRTPGNPTWTILKAPQISGARVVAGFQLQTTAATYAYGALPGDFLLSSLTDTLGNATFDYVVTGASPGDEIRLSIVAVLEPVPPISVFGPFYRLSLEDWDLPTTPNGPTPTTPNAKHLRGITVVY
jgi:hypothetical protein